MTLSSYWERYGRRRSAVGVGRPPTPMRAMERHQEAYHGVQARCPICGTWKFCKVIQDRWVGGAVAKLRLQCECGYAFTHDPKVHDHVLERTPGSGTGRRGSYKPRGHRERRWHTPNRG